MSPVRDNLVRYCPKCSRIGDAPRECINCCPDGADAVMVPPEVAKQARQGFRAQFGGEPDIAELVRGMSVSVDVSTGEDDVGHRYFGTVTEPMDHPDGKHGLMLLVQDAEPDFGHGDGSNPDEREIARPGYAGITVWVGGQECTQVVDRTVLETSRADELLRLFENARHLLRTEKEGDGHA